MTPWQGRNSIMSLLMSTKAVARCHVRSTLSKSELFWKPERLVMAGHSSQAETARGENCRAHGRTDADAEKL